MRVIFLPDPPAFLSFSAVGGAEESYSPLARGFDLFDPTDKFGQTTWELAEGEMGKIALNFALKKHALSPADVNVLIAGDLQNQCVASSGGLYAFGIPYIGLYGACSTCTEALLVASLYLSTHKEARRVATVTTSHNSAAERQFRTPLEYGAQRTPTAQWTATAAGAFLLGRRTEASLTASRDEFLPSIVEVMVGKIIDGATSDAANMGAAMAPAAADTLITYFKETGRAPSDFDAIYTGDLGEVGTSLLHELTQKEGYSLSGVHRDCGTLLYDKEKQDVHSGASGCGCSASVLASSILPAMQRGELSHVLFLSTGALMSPTSVQQGQSIFGIAPLIHLVGKQKAGVVR